MLNSKQRAYLRSLANTIDTILIVGKGGITEQVIKQADDALTAREIIKGKALENSETNSRETAEIIAEKVNADVVQVIGYRFILYKPAKNAENRKIVLPNKKSKK